MEIARIDITISEDDIFNGARQILNVIRPTWRPEQIKYKMLTDGITNKLVKCSLSDTSDAVLVRVYGNKTDLLIDRTAETRNIVMLNKVGLAPNLYATFNNGLAYEFVPGCTLCDESVIKPEIYPLVARKMGRLHRVEFEDSRDTEPMLWRKLDDFLKLVPERFSDAAKHEKYLQTVLPKDEIRNEIEFLKERLLQLQSPIVFTHNDLLLGNVVYTASNESVTFIDFEYAAFNYQAFDIGNHFSEFVGLDSIDYAKYPGKEFQYAWLKEYLTVFKKGEVSDEDVERLYVQVNQFALASHVFWGVWALIQAEHSYIDFDFMGYAAIRFNEYFSRKEQFLSLEMPR
ncbi:PREDICTED: ethanolamine kinase [Nicrophorus vespilloides]|uniref:ethanolamine kinase n=1 Tax=Nicrophorus vespilloides TaxID=110193 RepID=A0ABM1NJY0_NICVS|nr:PREDICTED: ethanolamine kinase [Nicrophorus vespilloides]